MISPARIAAAPGPGIWWPTDEQLRETYKSIADQAFADHTARRLLGPPSRNMKQFPSWDISTPGEKRTKTLYLVYGDLYQRNSIRTVVGRLSAWYKIGPAPLF